MSPRHVIHLALTALSAFAALRCAGTETDNPASSLTSFVGGECEKTPSDQGPPPAPVDAGAGSGEAAQRVGAITGTLAQLGSNLDVAGLSCVRWTRTSPDTLHVELTNIVDGCGLEWSGGAARVEGDQVYLAAKNPDCSVAGCGNCLYDFEFDVKDVPGSDLGVHFSITDEDGVNCNSGYQGAEVGEHRFSIRYDLEGETRCRFLPPYVYEPPPPPCTLQMICGGQAGCECASGQSCEVVEASGDSRCLAECTSREDCAVPEAFGCVDGVCRPTAGW